MKLINKFKLRFLNKDVKLCKGFSCAYPENIYFKGNAYVGPYAKFWGEGKIIIKDNVIIGPNITIMTSSHNYNGDKLPYDSTNIIGDVVIEENVWIGANVNIVPGVTIGEGAIIGMGAVVTKNVPKCSIVGGNPAVVIKSRDVEKYSILKEEGKLYLKNKFNKSRS